MVLIIPFTSSSIGAGKLLVSSVCMVVIIAKIHAILLLLLCDYTMLRVINQILLNLR